MPAVHGYQQYCPIARALDVLGDRWTLLILRELTMAGDRRFTDLRRSLPGIAPGLLSERLRMLTEQGLVTTHELPPPAARTVYGVTARGREAVPVLRALARFGLPLLDPPADTAGGLVVQPAMAVQAAVSAFYDPAAAVGLDQRYELQVDGQSFPLASRRGGPGDSHDAADLTLRVGAATLVDIRQGRTTLSQALADGRASADGPGEVLAGFQRVFRLG
jgi:DNA-binding HxlR family transcriptional regulator